jgi:hypothetical protein
MFAAAPACVFSQLSLDDLHLIKEKFRGICTESGAVVSLDQFKQVMTELGFERQPLERMYSMFDFDGDNSVRLAARPQAPA